MAENTIAPLTPIKNSLGETMGSILGMVANPHGATGGIRRPRYNANVGDPGVEMAPGRPATMKGIDVTRVGDPYEHERGSGVRTLSPAIVRRRFDEGI
jgi:hypothetical protein